MSDEVELYEALIARPGVYQADGGPITITPARTARWEREFNRFRAAGYEIPTPWAHKLDAIPEDSADPYALDTALVKANAGYVERLRRDARTGELFMLAHVPPGYRYDKARKALVNDRENTVVKECSPGFGDMIDGQGVYREDVLFHVALCTHPVLPGQPGFGPGGTAARRPGTRFLSRAGKITRLQFLSMGGRPMATDGDNDKGKGPPKPPEIPAGTDGPLPLGDAAAAPPPEAVIPDVAPDAPAAPDPATDPTLAAPPPPDPAGLNAAGGFSPAECEQFKQIFAQLGSALLPDTGPQNIKERMLVVLHTAANQGASLAPQPAGGAQGQPLDLSTEGAVPDQNATGAGMGGLGTATFMHHKTGAILQLAAADRAAPDAAAKTENEQIAAEWDKLGASGPAALKAVVAREKGQVLPRFHLSLNPQTGQVVNKRARDRLYFAKELLAASGVYRLTKALSRAAVAPNPTAGIQPRQPTPPPGAGGPSDADLQAEIARQYGIQPSQVVIRRTPASAAG